MFLLSGWETLRSWVDEWLPEGSLRARFAKGAFWSVAGVVIAQGLALVASVLVVRIFGSRDIYGHVGMLRSTVQMFGVLAGLSLGMTNIKYVAEFRGKDPGRAGRIVGLSGAISFVSGLVMALALIVAARWLAEKTLNAPHIVTELRVGAAILFFETLNGVQTGTLAGCEAFRTIAWLSLMRGLVSFPLMVGGAWLGMRYGRPVLGITIALALSSAAGWVIYDIALRRLLRREGITVTRQGTMSEIHVLWRYSLPAMLSSAVAGPVLWAANAILVNRHPKGYDELGVYNAASQWQLPVTFLTVQMATILLPMLSSFERDHAGKAKGETVLDATFVVTAVTTVPVVAVLACFATLVMSLYGTQYAGTETVLIAILFVAGAKAVGSLPGTVIASRGAMWSALLINAAWSLSFLVLVYVWSSRGAQGLADSFSLAYAASAIYGVLYCVGRGFFGWSMAWRLWALTGALGAFSYGFVCAGSLPRPGLARATLLAVALVTTLAVGWRMWRTVRGRGRAQ